MLLCDLVTHSPSTSPLLSCTLHPAPCPPNSSHLYGRESSNGGRKECVGPAAIPLRLHLLLLSEVNEGEEGGGGVRVKGRQEVGLRRGGCIRGLRGGRGREGDKRGRKVRDSQQALCHY